jgi:shikimate dehydrogenase
MSERRDRFVVGLIGAGIGTSASPYLHEREADGLGLRYAYQIIDIEALGLPPESVGQLVGEARRMGFAGLNITHPGKRLVVEHLDELAPVAAALGAVNTVVFRDGRAIGHNTDGTGFAAGFERGLPSVRLKRVLQLGAGGAGAAVAHALRGLGAEQIIIVDAEPGRAAALAATVDGAEPDGLDRLAEHAAAADGIVNATPVGMVGHPGLPLPVDLLRPEHWVADVIYRPLRTELLRRADELGCRTLTGGGMVVYQAAASMRLFTGRADIDAERMRRSFEIWAGSHA